MPQALNRVSLDLSVELVTKLDRARASRGCSRAKLIRDVLTLWASKVPDPQPAPVVEKSVDELWDAA
jgi:hypothetical protein